MKRWIIVALALALLLLGAAPAWAHLPPGQGLVSFGPVSCEGLGTVEVFGPRGEGAATGFAETGEHVVVKSLSGTFTDLQGNVFSFTKSFGAKAGLTTFTCTQHIEEPGEGTGDLTVVVATVPPQ
jgi:hypothetical protein